MPNNQNSETSCAKMYETTSIQISHISIFLMPKLLFVTSLKTATQFMISLPGYELISTVYMLVLNHSKMPDHFEVAMCNTQMRTSFMLDAAVNALSS